MAKAPRSTKPAADRPVKKPAARPRPPKAAGTGDGEAEVRAKIAAMPEPYRLIGERLHALILQAGPGLSPRVWYGMPGYAKDGVVVCFFRGGPLFQERYMTLGFNYKAQLDDGAMWPVAFALTALTPAEEERITALVRRAIG